MAKYLVVRSWVVEADSGQEAVQLQARRAPGRTGHARASRATQPIRVTFATNGVQQGFDEE
jgi:hypothetical protein